MTYTGNLINGIQETLKLHIKNSELNILQTQSNIICQHLRGTRANTVSQGGFWPSCYIKHKANRDHPKSYMYV